VLDPLSSCWDRVFAAKPFQLVTAIKNSLARIYVLTIAKHLLNGLIKIKQALNDINNSEAMDIKTLNDLLTQSLEVLTAFTLPHNPGSRTSERRDSDRTFLRCNPVPAQLARYLKELPFLSQTFLSLVRLNLKLLGAWVRHALPWEGVVRCAERWHGLLLVCVAGAGDNFVRRTLLQNAVRGRYYYSTAALKRDLDLIVSYCGIQSLYVEYFGQLSRETFVLGGLPYTPLSKLEIYAILSIGQARHKVHLDRERSKASGASSVTPSMARAGPPELDSETMDAILDTCFTEDAFRCSPFMVTFGPKGVDTRPTYQQVALDEQRFPQLYLSLSRHVYMSRVTRDGLEEFIRAHSEVVTDYLTCLEMAAIAEAAIGGGADLKDLLTSQRIRGNWTCNLYADIVVSDFITKFYQDFMRKVASDPAVLAFSQRFKEQKKEHVWNELKQVLHLGDASGSKPLLEAKPDWELVGGLGGSPKREVVAPTISVIVDKSSIAMYILMVSERVVQGLRLADEISVRDPISGCEMAEAIVVWCLLWAHASLGRCISMSKAEDKKDQAFDSLRRVCALCSDLQAIAKYCDVMIGKIRPFDNVVTPVTPSARSRASSATVSPSSGAASPVEAPPPTPSRAHRMGFIVSPMAKSQKATPSATRDFSRTPRASGVMGLTKKSSMDQGTASDVADISGHDVIVNDLSSMVEELKLLSAQCLEHATEIATRITNKVCRSNLNRQNAPTRASIILTRSSRSLMKGGEAALSPRGDVDVSVSGSKNAAPEFPAQPRAWSVDLCTTLFRPLAEFSRSDEFSSEVILPRLVESCLHSVLELLASEGQGRVTMGEARAFHTDFLYLKDWMEGEQKHQLQGCSLNALPVFDRIHVILNVLVLPASLSAWSESDFASLYLLPDAPKWVAMRSDRGRVSFPALRRFSRNVVPESPRASKRLSTAVQQLDLSQFAGRSQDDEDRRRGSSSAQVTWNSAS
jgi:hypothetical protein